MDAPLHISFCRKNRDRQIRMQRENYEYEIQSKIMTESFLNETLRLKMEECEASKSKLEEAVKETEELKKWGWPAMKQMGVIMLYVLVAFKVSFA